MSGPAISSTFVVALVVTVAATPLVSRLARAFEVIDRPGDRNVNRRLGIPLLGGLAVALGTFVGLSAGVLASNSLPMRGHVEGLIAGSSLLLATGVRDDKRALRAWPKFLVQIGAAAIAISFGFRIDHITDPFSHQPFTLPLFFSWIVTTLWIVGVTNAVNLIDGLDGLATGVSAIIGLTLTIICWQVDQRLGVLLGAALVGALLGFLPFNFPPARIFLGDTGALFIGFTLALLSLEAYAKIALLTFVVPLLALAVPLMDTTLSILRRLRRRRGVFSADRQHIHHRLLESSGTQRAAVLSLYFLTACFCVIALSFTRLEGLPALFFLGAVLVLTLRLVRNLGLLGEPAAADASPPAANTTEGKHA